MSTSPAQSAPAPLPSLRTAVASAALLLAACGAPGCGPSELARGYDAYTASVEEPLEREQEHWSRLSELLQQRQEDPGLPRYYEYARGTALPFYTELRANLRELEPGLPPLREAHRHLIEFADARFEFVNIELAAQDLNARASADAGFAKILSGLHEAENLRIAYLEAVEKSVPDAKFTELYQLVQVFQRDYFDRMREGALDPDAVQQELARHVLPALEDLRRRKYSPDAEGTLLKKCVEAWLEWHRNLAQACPLLDEVLAAKAHSEASAQAADEAIAAFRKALDDARRER